MMPPNRLTVGLPLELTPESLDQVAEVTTVDIVVARALWLHGLIGTRYERYAHILDAPEVA